MRRKDRENNSPEFFELVFDKAAIINIAFRDEPFPYCLPFNFGKIENKIYIHCAKEGRKLDLIRAHPEVAFNLAIDIRIDREKYTTYFKSVCGTGQASLVEDPAEKAAALDAIGEKYAALCPRPSPMSLLNRVSVIKIAILSLSGKNCEPRED
ncbi:MAG: pyridoxamine 5'-phosphate oxidase family protein [Desulfovibrio sp.]|nr:pyridoxamine 5'-phosphate oxidase family protein [Desulfovibrio sp.]